MFIVETRNLDTMTWGRKSALLLLAMTVFWTAMPASACLLAMPAMGQHSCCDAMDLTLACAPAGTTSNGSCCQAARQDPAVAPATQSTEHAQRLAFVLTGINLLTPGSRSAARPNALEAPPPKSSPGGNSILRI
jgi:hypothetical protein